MRITELQIDASGLPASIRLSPDEVNKKVNWITVLTGENGTRKSLLLRLVTGAALDKSTFKSPRYPTAYLKLVCTRKVPLRTIALSGTPSDRFPVISGVPLLRSPTTFDIDDFRYFGPRYAGSVGTRSRAATTLSFSLLENIARTFRRSLQAGAVLDHLRYDGVIRISVAANPKLSPKRGQAANKLLEAMVNDLDNRLAGSPQSESALRGFVAAHLPKEKEYQRLLELLPKSFTFLIDFNRKELMRQADLPDADELAMLLASGIFVTEELSFRAAVAPGADLDAEVRPEIWIDSADLSSGQWQLVNCLLNLALTVEDDALVLVDEPENSLHPEWQREYVKLLRLTLSSVRGCHVVIATHSPLVAAGVRSDEGNIVRLAPNTDGSGVDVTQSTPVNGWLPDDVLQQRFNMDTARAPEIVDTANQALAILKLSDQADRNELRTLAARLQELAAGLPTTDPLLPALEAIVDLAMPDAGSQA